VTDNGAVTSTPGCPRSRNGLTRTHLGPGRSQAGNGRGRELSQSGLTLGKVVVQQCQVMAAFDDTAAFEEINQPNSDDLQHVCEV
jgi:hypothetical protein